MSREMFSGNLRNRLHSDEWLIWQDQYEAKENLKYESLFALSNGYLGIRGSHEEGTKITLPYLYINGVFDKSETFMQRTFHTSELAWNQTLCRKRIDWN